jgi:hypothetical protein
MVTSEATVYSKKINQILILYVNFIFWHAVTIQTRDRSFALDYAFKSYKQNSEYTEFN